MAVYMTFGRNIKNLREASGLSTKQAAAKLGITVGKLWYYESGKTQPKLETLVKICDVYGYRDIYHMLTDDIYVSRGK